MNREFFKLDLEELQSLYQKETKLLHAELIAGTSWENLTEQKIRVTELAITIHRKKYPLYFNPAEFTLSREENLRNPE